MATHKIPAAKLEIGMYVSRLDRPWRETPFLFQGFYVQDQEELDTLNKLCKDVFILTGEDIPGEVQEPVGDRAAADTSELKEILGQQPTHTGEHEKPFVEELSSAKKHHEDVSRLAHEAWESLQKGEAVNLEIMQESISVMTESVLRNPDAFVWLSKVKKYDSYTYAHAVNVSVWATVLGKRLLLPQEKLEALALGGLLLDVGNIRLPKKLLEKRERLSNDEWDTIKTHVIHSIALIQRSKEVSQHVIDMVASHHERYDGSGYPKGLEGDEIPLLGQIAGIVDAYVSVTFPRAGLNAVPSDFATNVLFKQRNKYFKADLVDELIGCVGLYPPGSLIELNTGQVAIVVTQNSQWRLRPRIMLILDKNKKPFATYPIIDLMKETEDEDGNHLSIKTGIRDGAYAIDLSKLPF